MNAPAHTNRTLFALSTLTALALTFTAACADTTADEPDADVVAPRAEQVRDRVPAPANEIAAAPRAPASVASPASAAAPAPALATVRPQPRARVEAPAHLEVVSGAIGTAVVDRQLEGADSVFDNRVGGLVAHVTVRNMDAPSSIKMVWKRDGQPSATMTLPVGVSPRWRTWSKKNIRAWDSGHWTVDVLDADDNLLQTIRFDVVPAQHAEDIEEGC